MKHRVFASVQARTEPVPTQGPAFPRPRERRAIRGPARKCRKKSRLRVRYRNAEPEGERGRCAQEDSSALTFVLSRLPRRRVRLYRRFHRVEVCHHVLDRESFLDATEFELRQHSCFSWKDLTRDERNLSSTKSSSQLPGKQSAWKNFSDPHEGGKQ